MQCKHLCTTHTSRKPFFQRKRQEIRSDSFWFDMILVVWGVPGAVFFKLFEVLGGLGAQILTPGAPKAAPRRFFMDFLCSVCPCWPPFGITLEAFVALGDKLWSKSWEKESPGMRHKKHIRICIILESLGRHKQGSRLDDSSMFTVSEYSQSIPFGSHFEVNFEARFG